MRYAKYNFYLNSETNEKELPSQVNGVCFTDSNETQIIGYNLGNQSHHKRKQNYVQTHTHIHTANWQNFNVLSLEIVLL